MKGALSKRSLGEHAHNAHDPILDNERVAGEGGHLFISYPVLVINPRIVLDIVGQMRSSFLSNQTDFELSKRNSTVTTIQPSVHSSACLQLQFLAIAVERPDAGKGRVEMPNHCFGAGMQHSPQSILARQSHPDFRTDC